MTTKVRMFTLDGLRTASVTGIGLQHDSVQLLKFPYIGKALLTPDTSTAQASDTSIANNQAITIVHVQVEAGKSVHYEVTPESQDLRVADTNSPIMRGDNTIIFGPRWRLSVLEATT